MEQAAEAVPWGEFWSSIDGLCRSGRHRDAVVTLRVVANRSGEPQVRLALGAVLAEQGLWRSAVDEWMLVIESAQEQGDRALLADVYHNLASLYREQGHMRLAREFQRRSMAWTDGCSALDLMALASDALAAHESDAAEQLLEVAETLLDDQQDDSLRGDLRALQGLTAVEQDDWWAAQCALEQALAVHSTGGDASGAARDLLNLSYVQARQGHLAIARQSLEAARERLEACGDLSGANRARHLLARWDRCPPAAADPAAWN